MFNLKQWIVNVTTTIQTMKNTLDLLSALKSVKAYSMTSKSTLRLVVPNGTRSLMCGCGASNSCKFLLVVNCTSTGTVNYASAYTGSAITLSTATNRLIIQNGSSSALKIMWINYA